MNCAVRLAVATLIGAIFVLSPAAAVARGARTVAVGYVAAFRGLDLTIERTDIGAFTHFNLAFANPDPDGSFVRDGQLTCMHDQTGANMSVEALRAPIAQLRAKGAKVLMSVAGGVVPACSGDWRVLLAPDRRAATVAALVELTTTLGLDGIDIDIEGALLTEIDRAGNYTPFVAALSAALKKSGKLLTCATASYEGGMIPMSAIPFFDLVNVMSYDAVGPSWGTPGVEHATYAMAERDLDLWLARGVKRERLVLGVPFYGYGLGGFEPHWSYRDIAAANDLAADSDVLGELCATCRYITYNGPATIAKKAALAAKKAGGVMVWELSQDTPDHRLTRALLPATARKKD